MDKVNKDGKTLDEYLKDLNPNQFKRPSLTVDAVLFSVQDDKPVVLLIKRGNHPHIGEWALPGGFVNEQESCESAVVREFEEETGLKDLEFEQLVTISTPHRDIRGWTVSNCFFSVIESPFAARANDDADDAKWFSIDYAAKGDTYELVLKSADGVNLRASMNIVRNAGGKIDLNMSTVENSEGIAFDHAKLILFAIEKL